LRGNYVESGERFIKCVLMFAQTDDEHSAAKALRSFVTTYEMALHEDQQKLEAMWKKAGLGDLPKSEE
jgi:hypothetical protein